MNTKSKPDKPANTYAPIYNLRMPRDDQDKLRAAAARAGVSASELARKGIARAVREVENASEALKG